MDTQRMLWLLSGVLCGLLWVGAWADDRPGGAPPARIASITPLPLKNGGADDLAAALAQTPAAADAARTACNRTAGQGCPRPLTERDRRMFLMLMFSFATRPSPPLK
jgi:hypothetical protein